MCLSHVLSFSSYAGRVVGSTLKAQRENPEMTVRNTDPVLKGAKQRLEQLTQVAAPYSQKNLAISAFCEIQLQMFFSNGQTVQGPRISSL